MVAKALVCWAQYGGGYAGVEEGLGCSVREAGGRQELGRSEAVRAGRRRKPWSAVRRGEKEAVSSGVRLCPGLPPSRALLRWDPSLFFMVSYGASFITMIKSPERADENGVDTGSGACETRVQIFTQSLSLHSLVCKMG